MTVAIAIKNWIKNIFCSTTVENPEQYWKAVDPNDKRKVIRIELP